MDECEVDATIVQPYQEQKDYVKRHDENRLPYARSYPAVFRIASLSPHTGKDKYQVKWNVCEGTEICAVKLPTIGARC